MNHHHIYYNFYPWVVNFIQKFKACGCINWILAAFHSNMRQLIDKRIFPLKHLNSIKSSWITIWIESANACSFVGNCSVSNILPKQQFSGGWDNCMGRFLMSGSSLISKYRIHLHWRTSKMENYAYLLLYRCLGV